MWIVIFIHRCIYMSGHKDCKGVYIAVCEYMPSRMRVYIWKPENVCQRVRKHKYAGINKPVTS